MTYLIVKGDRELANVDTWQAAKFCVKFLLTEDPDLSPVEIILVSKGTEYPAGTAGENGYGGVDVTLPQGLVCPL